MHRYAYTCAGALLVTLAGGSIEILKNRVAGHIFGRRFSQRPD